MKERYVIEVRPAEEPLKVHGPWVADLTIEETVIRGHYHLTPWQAAMAAAGTLQFELTGRLPEEKP